MSDLTFTLDDSALRRDLALCKKQIPFAMALALTRTMQAAQKDTLAAESKVFHVRTDYLTSPKRPGYFRVVSAKKDNLAATLGTRAPLMEQEVFGGEKKAGKHLQSVPTDAGVGSTKDAALRGEDDMGTLLKQGGKWPWRIVNTAKPGGFFLKLVGGFQGKQPGRITDNQNRSQTMAGRNKAVLSKVRDRAILFQKTGPTHPATRKYLNRPVGREVYAKAPIQAIYVFEARVKIGQKLPFQKIVEMAVAEYWPGEATKAVNEALWTAK